MEEATGGVRAHENGGATLAKNGIPDSSWSLVGIAGRKLARDVFVQGNAARTEVDQ